MKDKVLYVDDEPINLTLFKLHMAKHYEVITAESGINALQILDNDPDINIVFSDMKMPHMSGMEFIEKAFDKKPKVRYFILSGYDMDSNIKKAINSNIVKGYFQKPFNINEILDTLKK